MTASPDTNQYDIYAIFDHNIAYDLRLNQALEEDLVCPFHYYGITDLEIDGEVFDDASGLRNFSRLVSDERVDYVIERLAMDMPIGNAGDGCLDYIFTVDIFNEGVDIPEINQVIMLRPTESPVVFVQQLGRGLRKQEGKEYVVIPKSTHKKRMQENFEVFDFTLSAEDMERIAALDKAQSSFFSHQDPATVEWFAQIL